MNTEAAQILDAQPAEAPKADAPPAATETKAEEPKFSPKIESILRREQKALRLEREAKARESQIEEKLRVISQFEEAKKDPLKALELLGLNYNELTQALLSNGQLPPEVQIKRLEDRLDSFKTEQEKAEEKRAEEDRQRKEAEEAKIVSEYKSEINQFIEENKDRYEFIRFEGLQDLVYDVIDEHYKRTMDEETGEGKVMPFKEAADKVEAHLEAKYQKTKDLKKLKTIFGSIPQVSLKESFKDQKGASRGPITLTNNLSAGAQRPNGRPPEDQRIKGILDNFIASRAR